MAPTMGAKFEEKVNSNPGPGQYDADASKLQSAQKGSVKFGLAERKDNWADKAHEDMPGPGTYTESKSTFGQTGTGPTMGAKIEEKLNSNPGPGTYDADASKIQQNIGGSVRIGQAERQDLWTEKNQADMPGPGNYSDMTAFGKGTKGGYMGTKQETEIKMMPGPADYDNSGNFIETSAQRTVFSQSNRKELWTE